MVLAPWNAPEPLARAWCLFELYATVVENMPFGVCFVPAERQKFEAALEEDSSVFLGAVARINVADAQASNPDDLRMILDEVQRMEGGCARLNAVAIGEMRAAVVGIVRDMLPTRRAAGSLGSLNAVAILLKNLGERDEARRLYTEVIDGHTAQLGASRPRCETTPHCATPSLLDPARKRNSARASDPRGTSLCAMQVAASVVLLLLLLCSPTAAAHGHAEGEEQPGDPAR
jgi:hypothetical protein